MSDPRSYDLFRCCDDAPDEVALVYAAPVGEGCILSKTEPAETVSIPVERSERIAYHEAAHAMAALAIGVDVIEVTIDVQPHSTHGRTDHFEADAIISMAGLVGENWRRRHTYSHPDHHLLPYHERICARGGGQCDLCSAVRSAVIVAGSTVPTGGVAAFRALERQTHDLIKHPAIWAAIRELAAELMERGTATGLEAEAIAQKHFDKGGFPITNPVISKDQLREPAATSQA